MRNTAFRHGAVATFTPKLEEGVAGSGLHFHLELEKDGRNAMRGADGKLSAEARKLIGGLCEYADSLTAFGNTVSSAYLRLVPNQEAPTRICWSDLNRSALIRVPLGWTDAAHLARKVNPADTAEFTDERGGRQTVEIRSPDGSAMVHLTLAGIAMAANWAFKGDLSPVQGLRPARARRRPLRQGQHLRRQGAPQAPACPAGELRRVEPGPPPEAGPLRARRRLPCRASSTTSPRCSRPRTTSS
ncbi:MAG: glutamine synthetase [Comamonadaceae bacterium]|nr:glutamine synthetase [Comamonadaceae bacterium]